MRVDASRVATVITCVCGFRVLTPPDRATAVMDRHRAATHPRQATYVKYNRRARGKQDRAAVSA